MSHPFDLQRFLDAQEPVFEQVLEELRRGRKESHWIWFIFPQMKGLGSSEMANHYGIGSREEAEAYLQHPVLGDRLKTCAELVNKVQDRDISSIMGYPDDLKFRSSMTLFSDVSPTGSVFEQALAKYFGGQPDPRTQQLLG